MNEIYEAETWPSIFEHTPNWAKKTTVVASVLQVIKFEVSKN